MRLEEQVLVAVIPGCARTLEAARVLLYSADPAHGPRVIWESGGEVDLGATEDEFREVRLDAATFPASHGSYEALLRGEVEISEDSSWLEVQVDPRGAVTFGQVPIYDIDALGTGGEGVWHGSSGPVPPEKIGMSPTELCSD